MWFQSDYKKLPLKSHWCNSLNTKKKKKVKKQNKTLYRSQKRSTWIMLRKGKEGSLHVFCCRHLFPLRRKPKTICSYEKWMHFNFRIVTSRGKTTGIRCVRSIKKIKLTCFHLICSKPFKKRCSHQTHWQMWLAETYFINSSTLQPWEQRFTTKPCKLDKVKKKKSPAS